MRKVKLAALAVVVLGAGAVRTAAAQNIRDWGMNVSVGGGSGDFIDKSMRDMTGFAVGWQATATIGTKLPVAFEAAYTGSAQHIDAIGLDTSALLVSNGVTGSARLNISTGELQPYFMAGVGYRRLSITNASFNTSDVASTDNVLDVPFSAGIAYRLGPVMLDARGTVHTIYNNDLIPAASGQTTAPALDSWEWAGRVGYEF